MKTFLIACFAATSLCSLASVANASPVQNPGQPITVAANSTPSDAPYMFAKLHDDIQMLQTEIQALGTMEGQTHGNSRYIFAAMPNSSTDSVGG